MGKTYGYVRVSSKDQNEDRQLIAMKERGVDENNIFVDKQSGRDFNRPQYQRLIHRLRADDLIYVKSIDRLGRNYQDIMEQWKWITKERKADICILDMPLLDTRRNKDLLGAFISDLVLAILSYISENERNMIKSRQAEGISAAKLRGVRFGRPCKPVPDNFYKVYKQWKMKEITIKQASAECGMPCSTFYDKAIRIERNI